MPHVMMRRLFFGQEPVRLSPSAGLAVRPETLCSSVGQRPASAGSWAGLRGVPVLRFAKDAINGQDSDRAYIYMAPRSRHVAESRISRVLFFLFAFDFLVCFPFFFRSSRVYW